MAFHELAGLAFVAGKFKQYDKHPVFSPINKDLVSRMHGLHIRIPEAAPSTKTT